MYICINHLMPSALGSISNRKGVWLVLLIPCFIEIPASNAISEDPDQMQCSASGSTQVANVPFMGC